jgi:hypothetical protein
VKRALLLIALAACGTRSRDPAAAKGAVGKATGDALVAAIAAADATMEPWRCARLGDPVSGAAPTGWTLDGQTIRGGVARKTARVVFVSEARGASDATVAALLALRKQLDPDPVDVVVSLGGLGGTRDEIERALDPIARGAPWLVIAIPGDRESIEEHRAAVTALAATGAAIVDGSQVRVIDLPAIAIGSLPGARYPERLGAGNSGCLRDEADAEALLARLREIEKKPRVLAVQDAPRGATDLAPGGVHAGEVELARAIAAAPVELVVHRAVDDTSSGGVLKKPLASATAAVGAIDATARYRDDGTRVLPSALLLTVGERETAWKPLVPRVVP